MALQIDNLYLKFGDRQIFEALNFSFEKGQVYRLCGASGVGKSTLLRSLNQLQLLDQGMISLAGQSELSMMEFRSKVLYFPQQPRVSMPTIREELLYPFSLTIYREVEKPSDEALKTLLAKVALDYLKLDQDTSSLSPGEQQRLSFIRIFLLSAEFLLLDEPFSAIDEPNSKEMWDFLLAEQKQKGFSVIFVQHQSYPWMEDGVVNLDLKDGQLSERAQV